MVFVLTSKRLADYGLGNPRRLYCVFNVFTYKYFTIQWQPSNSLLFLYLKVNIHQLISIEKVDDIEAFKEWNPRCSRIRQGHDIRYLYNWCQRYTIRGWSTFFGHFFIFSCISHFWYKYQWPDTKTAQRGLNQNNVKKKREKR